MQNLFKKLPVAIATGMIALTVPGVANAFTMSPGGPGSYEEGLVTNGFDGFLSNTGGGDTTNLGSLIEGKNTLKATFGGPAGFDYFSVTIDKGYALNGIFLESGTWDLVNNDDVSFIGMEEGDTFDYEYIPGVTMTADGLLGWSHLRSTQVGPEEKILYEMSVSNLSTGDSGVAAIYAAEADALTPPDFRIDKLKNVLPGRWLPGAKGFDEPLGKGTYSFWLRQAGTSPEVSVELNFETVAVPEPTGVLGTVVAFGLAALVNKKRKRS